MVNQPSNDLPLGQGEERTETALCGPRSIARRGRENFYPRITHRWSSTSTTPAIRSMPAGLRPIRESRKFGLPDLPIRCGPKQRAPRTVQLNRELFLTLFSPPRQLLTPFSALGCLMDSCADIEKFLIWSTTKETFFPKHPLDLTFWKGENAYKSGSSPCLFMSTVVCH